MSPQPPSGDLLLVDGHNDLPWAHREAAGYDLDVLDIARPQPALHTDIPRLRAGGVRAQFWSVFVPSTLTGEAAVRATREQIGFVHAMADRYDELELCVSVDAVERAVAHGRIASLIGMEGGHSIDGSLDVLAEMYDSGARYMTLTHNDNVAWADSATDEAVLGGLSDFGRDVVTAMNNLGMAVDLAHVSADVMRDALDRTSAPIVFSHSNARAICDIARNVPDDVLERLPANGGVCMATFVPMFTRQATADWYAACRGIAAARGLNPRSFADLDPVMAERARTVPPPTVTVHDVADQVEHIRDVAGVDHVGLGGDFDGTTFVATGLEDVSAYPALFAELADRGWARADLDKLAGRNALRTLRGVEDAAG